MSKTNSNNKDRKLNIYENNYLLIKLLPKYDQEKMALAMMDYFFKDEADTGFKDERSNIVWSNIKMVLDKSKIQSNNASKRWSNDANDNANDDTWHNAKKDTKLNAIYFLISNFIFLEDKGLLREKIKEWVKYKAEKNDYYKETGFKSLLTRIKKYTEKYGEDKVVDLIDECMSSNYQGIIFEKLSKPQINSQKIIEPIPEWFNKTIEADEVSDEEAEAFRKKLKDVSQKEK